MFLHDLDQVNNLVKVTNLVIIPRNNLYECICQSDTSFSIEDRCQWAAKEVRRNDSFVCVTQDTFQVCLRSFLHCSADFVVRSSLLQVNGQVNNRNVQSRNTH